MFNSKFYKTFKPDFTYTEGDTLVPSKALKYKTDPITKKIIETTSPRSKSYEKNLRSYLEEVLKNESLFPTKSKVFIIVTHWLHAKSKYDGCDLDNRAKLILDAMKGPIYPDDCQVKVLWTYKELLNESQESHFSFIVKIINQEQEEVISAMQQLFTKV